MLEPNRTPTKALVVLSGGQDSTTCAAWARERYAEVHAITFDYDQRHRRELDAARAVATNLKLDSHEVLHLGPFILLSTSPLTAPDTPLETYASFTEMDAIIGTRREATFVPMRNALFLTLAANRAVALGISDIVVGVCQMDNANYDDCRDVFLEAQEEAINIALGFDHREGVMIHLLAPLIYLSKKETIEMALEIPGAMGALALSHTCYAGESPPCGKCHSCVLRAEGFKQAGLIDPILGGPHYVRR